MDRLSRTRFAASGTRVLQFRRGHAAATASASQLAISSVPPVGAAIGNRPWPAYCRKRQIAGEQGGRDDKAEGGRDPDPRHG